MFWLIKSIKILNSSEVLGRMGGAGLLLLPVKYFLVHQSWRTVHVLQLINILGIFSKETVSVLSLSVVSNSFDTTDCSPSGSSVHGIFQARILEWVAIPFSRGSSWPSDWTCVSCIGRQILYHGTLRKQYRCVQILKYQIFLSALLLGRTSKEINVFQ